jgi:putative ABC transport system permease protein
MKRSPPPLAVWILTGILPGERTLEVLGDLEEAFHRRGRFARIWYWKETFVFAFRLLPDLARDAVALDLRYSARRLLHRPLLTSAAVATLALSIGATTAVYSVVRSVVLRPLPFPRSERIVSLCETNELVSDYCVASPPDVENWKERSRTLSRIGIARYWFFNVNHGGRSEGLVSGLATPSFFDVFELEPILGRLLRPGDERVALLSYALWQSSFGSEASVIGRSIRIDGEPFEVVGVLPARTRLPWHERVQLWTPLPFDPKDEENRDWRGFSAVARLAEGFSLADARSEMAAVSASLALDYPATNTGWGIRVQPLRRELVGATRETLLLFLGAVVLVYLIGCVNVANLLLARNAEKEREIALSVALGAGRRRVLSQLLSESLLLSCLGGVLGFVIGVLATRGLVAVAPSDVPRLSEVSLDSTVLALALGLSVVTALVFGLLPAWRASGVDPGPALSTGARGFLPGARTGPGGGLVVAELALAVVLLVSAGLLIRSFSAVLDWKPGFDRESVLTFQVFAPRANYPEGARVTDFFERLEEDIRAIPGVVSVGASSAGPLFGGRETTELAIEGFDASGDARPTARWYDVDRGYLPTLGLPLREGRWFTDADREDAPRVAIVNEAMAERYWPSGSAVGQRVESLGVAEGTTWEIVGVVGNVTPFFPDGVAEAEIYWPKRQFSRWATFFVLRSATDPEAVVSVARARVEKLDPDATFGRVSTMDELVQRELTAPRFQMLLMSVFAFMALVLAVVGVYGVVAHDVTRRRHEFGLRMSLGAGRSDILRLVLGSSARMAAAGLFLGGAAALAAGRALSHLLHGVAETDAVTYVVVAILLLVVTLLASYLPARRASRSDPMIALRCD